MRSGVFSEAHSVVPSALTLGTLSQWPRGDQGVVSYLGIEWSLIYEIFLSGALAALAVIGIRWLPELAAVWLGLILAKVIVRPQVFTDMLPHPSTVALSGYNVPFLLGLLAYPLRDRGRPVRWLALAAIPGFMAYAATRPNLELAWLWWGAAAVATVWLANQLPQLPERHLLVRLGDCTYGLFLVHVPLLFAVLYPAARLGWSGRPEALWLAGAVAIAGGLAFGRLETAVHARLRPVARWKALDPRTSIAQSATHLG
jgi:peptidoglycan/LPS O-acetylase OafA/YrhL